MATTSFGRELSNLVFCGIGSGYQYENDSMIPRSAVNALKAKINHIVLPGLRVYSVDANCPEGGEQVAAYIGTGDRDDLLVEAEKLRHDMKQKAITVSFQSAEGTSQGFIAITQLSLEKAGLLWQRAAVSAKAQTGIYVSCGIADFGKVRVISGEATPLFTSNMKTWRRSVEAICDRLELTPRFSQIDCYCLK